jgi:hypothetical protein
VLRIFTEMKRLVLFSCDATVSIVRFPNQFTTCSSVMPICSLLNLLPGAGVPTISPLINPHSTPKVRTAEPDTISNTRQLKIHSVFRSPLYDH